jgi:hypothetical protein
MPKEVIYDSQDANKAVELGWQHDPGTVQLGATNEMSPFKFPADSGMEGLPFNGWFVELDRAGINRLIGKLRRARDNAFGRDE